ncbi:MAG: cytidine deaminase [Bacilli bacterium]|nr:cytidine deaminase [Bacilli bacterium]
MKEKLIELLNNSYAPYSHFRVSAILVCKNGQEYNGVNVENASFGATICAERSAILGAVSDGYRKEDFDKLYVMCDNDKIGMPCFECRQVFLEFFDKDMQVICMNPKGEELVLKVSELCPYPFDSEDLK